MSEEAVPVETPPLWRRALAEALGTGLLVAVVVGSAAAAARYSPDDVGLQLLENSIATGLGLAFIILMFQTVSGGHINPVITLADRALGGTMKAAEIVVFILAQILGGIGGTLLANAMFGAATTISTSSRGTPENLLGEVVATAGLVLLVFALARTGRLAAIGPAVGAYIAAGFWFISSLSFANPALTLARIFTDSIAGIDPGSAWGYVGAELVGAAIGVGLVLLFFPRKRAVVS